MLNTVDPKHKISLDLSTSSFSFLIHNACDMKTLRTPHANTHKNTSQPTHPSDAWSDSGPPKQLRTKTPAVQVSRLSKQRGRDAVRGVSTSLLSPAPAHNLWNYWLRTLSP